MKKLILLAILIIVILIMTISAVVWVLYKDKSRSIDLSNVNTGAVAENADESTKKANLQREKLYYMLPLKKEGFVIDFNLDKDKFRVVFLTPYEQSKKDFDQYLISVGITNIPKSEFEFVLE